MKREVVILGTSPVLLLEGLFRARAGQHVTFIESSEDIGGAWATTGALGYVDIDAACHLMVNYPGVYSFIEEECGIQMEPWLPEPLTIRGSKVKAFNARGPMFRFCLTLAKRLAVLCKERLIQATKGGEGTSLGSKRDDRICRTWNDLSKRCTVPWFGSNERRAIQHPVGGVPAFLKVIHSELVSLGCEFLQETARVLKVQADGGAHLTCASGNHVEALHLVVSESVALSRIESCGESKEFSANERRHSVLVMRVEGSSDQILSYVALPFCRDLARVADVTNYCTYEGSGAKPPGRILVCEIHDLSDGATATAVLAFDCLKQQKLVPDDARLADHMVRHIKLQRGDPDLVPYMKRLGSNSLTIVPSWGDLTYHIRKNRKRWMNL